MKNIFFLTAIIFCLSCAQNENSNNDDDQIVNSVQLNNGDKWVVNPETQKGVENMKMLMGQFQGEEGIESYNNLSISLKSEFKLIFKNCTMTGQAHEELHHYLMPVMGMMNGLNSTNLKECKDHFVQLNDHLMKYNDYFKQ